jgi:hypothetical protein
VIDNCLDGALKVKNAAIAGVVVDDYFLASRDDLGASNWHSATANKWRTKQS